MIKLLKFETLLSSVEQQENKRKKKKNPPIPPKIPPEIPPKLLHFFSEEVLEEFRRKW